MAVRYQTEDCNFQFKGRRKTSDWIRRVAAAEGYRTGDITVVFCSDAALLEVNRQFLSHDYFTDIITFDYTDQEKKIISGDDQYRYGTRQCRGIWRNIRKRAFSRDYSRSITLAWSWR